MQKLTGDDMAYLQAGMESKLDPLAYSRHLYDESGVVRHRNLVYFEGEARDAVRHRLDFYVPPVRFTQFPIVIFVHGGGWRMGSKDDLMGLYGRFGQYFAQNGIAFAAVNHRLTPRVQHPDHLCDVVQATDWLFQNAGQFGFDPSKVSLFGHSSGAHLVSLLALQPNQWAKEWEAQLPEIKSVIAMSGPYDIHSWADGELAELDSPSEETSYQKWEARHRDRIKRTRAAFASDHRKEASPMYLVGNDAPPFYLVHEERGDEMIEETKRFAAALQNAGHSPIVQEMANTNHISMLVELLRSPSVALDGMISFVRGNSE